MKNSDCFKGYVRPRYVLKRGVDADRAEFFCIQDCWPLGTPPDFEEIMAKNKNIFATEIFLLDEESYNNLINNEEGKFVIWVIPE